MYLDQLGVLALVFGVRIRIWIVCFAINRNKLLDLAETKMKIVKWILIHILSLPNEFDECTNTLVEKI